MVGIAGVFGFLFSLIYIAIAVYVITLLKRLVDAVENISAKTK